MTTEPTQTTITPNDNGPLQIMGNVCVVDVDGTVIQEGEAVWLCRCGGSANKPFCDGTHRSINFESEVRAERAG